MPRTKLLISAMIMIMIAVGITACGSEDKAPTVPMETTRVTLNLNNLKPLTGLNYQAWALIGNFGYDLGRFNVNSSGQIIDTTGAVVAEDFFKIEITRDYISDIGITIEPAHDTLTAPTSYFLGGSVSNGAATLSIEHDAGMSASFSALTGKFILATPTNGTENDELSGIWFMDNSGGFSAKGLNIPEIQSGWRYEGWVNVSGTNISTGKFSVSDEVDDTLRYGGSQSQPEFPGEDFLVNAPAGVTFPTDLSGQSAFITLEVHPDPNPGTPSPYKILQTTIPATATDHQTYTMEAVASANLPSGTVTLTVEE